MKNITRLLILVACLSLLAACAPAPTPTPAPTTDVAAIQTQAVQEAYAGMTAAAPTNTPPAPAGTPPPGAPVAVVPSATPGQPAGVALYNTAIMSGPGTSYVLYAALLGGSSVQVVGKSSDSQWWVISVPPAPNGQGWVPAAFLSTSDTGSVPVIATPPVPPTTDLVPPGPNDPQATTIANTYVRTGPGPEYPAYGIAQSGKTGWVIGTSEDGAWWVVRTRPQSDWSRLRLGHETIHDIQQHSERPGDQKPPDSTCRGASTFCVGYAATCGLSLCGCRGLR